MPRLMQNRNLITDGTAEAALLHRLWLEQNKATLREVSRKLQVSRQFVGMVYRGERTSGRVKRALVRRGAPVATRQIGN